MKVGHFRLRRRGDFFARSQAPLGYLEFAGWMARGVLWVDGWLTSDSEEPLEVTVKVGGEEQRSVRAERFSYSRPDLAEIPGATGQVLVLSMDRPEIDGHHVESLYIQANGASYRWTSRRGKPIQADLVARLRHKLSLQPEIRRDLGSFITDRCAQALRLDPASDPLFQSHASTFGDTPAEPAVEQAEGEIAEAIEEQTVGEIAEPALEEVEEAAIGEVGEPTAGDAGEPIAEDGEVRIAEDPGGDEEQTAELPDVEDPPPSFMANPAEPLGLCIDSIVATGGESFFVRGWIWDLYGVVEGLELVYPDGERRALLDSLIRAERSDVTDLFRPAFGDRAEGRHGFFGFFENGVPEGDQRRYRFELRLSDGGSLAAGTPALITDPFAGRDAVFASLPEMRYRDLELFSTQIHPANERIRSQRRERVAVRREFAHGEVPEAPEISLVIPVFDHIELVEHQLAQLADDPGFGDCEVILVLDARRHEAWLRDVVFYLSRLYKIPLQVLVLAHRSGHAAATNVGAAHARGRLLVLMHPDVFADGPGWLEAMAELYDSRPEIGVLAPKLLYEDQSVRHAGLTFARGLEPDDLWSISRSHQGLPRCHPAVEETRRVPAVSGACLMIRRDLFERLGGLRDVYFDTDYEDVDLCMRCAEEGLESWYLPAVELFHLEGLSPKSVSDWRQNPWTGLYDRWLQDRRWDEKIMKLMEEVG